MLIGIDGNEANIKKRVGSNIYSYQILKNIWQIQNSEFRVNNLEFRIYLKNDPLNDLPKETAWWQYKVLKPSFLWTQWRLPLGLYLTKEKPDVFFTPGHYAPRFCPMPLVISIMDLAFLRFPKQFKKNDLYQLINWTKYSIKKANNIFTISEFTKEEIIHFYNYPANKITVTHPGGTEFRIQNSEFRIIYKKLKRKYNIDDNNYFLYLGTLQPRKNLTRLIEAFSQILKLPNCQILKLIIGGKKGWLYNDIFREVKDLELADKVIFAGFVSEEEKIALLKNALSFVSPSLYEGFGIPVVEAMQLGCPVIISRNSSFPEVGGKVALYIENPQSVASIFQSLLKMIKLEYQDRQNLIKRGLEQSKKFSWSRAAKKTLEILKQKGG